MNPLKLPFSFMRKMYQFRVLFFTLDSKCCKITIFKIGIIFSRLTNTEITSGNEIRPTDFYRKLTK